MPSMSYSIGSSLVMIFVSVLFSSFSAEYSVVGVRSPSDVEIERVVYVVPAQKGSRP